MLRRRAFWVSFGVYLALAAVWALATPLFGVADEPAHMIKAAAVARLELQGDHDRSGPAVETTVHVPEILASAPQVPCFAFRRDVTADCAAPLAGSDDEAPAITRAGTYPPAYYFVAGLPSLVFQSERGVYLMRMASALMCAGLLAMATTVALGRGRRFLLLGALTAITPTVLSFAGSVNPSGLELAASVAFWVVLIDVLAREPEDAGRSWVPLAVAGVGLAVARSISPLWVACAVAACVALYGVRPALALLRQRGVLIATVVVGAAGAFTAGWTVITDSLGKVPSAGPSPWNTSRNFAFSLTQTGRNYEEMIGVFGWLDAGPASLSILVVSGALGLLAILALALGTARERVVLLAVAAASVIVPVLLEAPRAPDDGFPWQGRYGMPLAVGVPVLAGHIVDRAGVLDRRLVLRITAVTVALLAAGQLFAHMVATHRFVSGTLGRFLYFLGGPWDPPLHPAALLVATIAVLAAGVVALERFLRADHAPVVSDGSPIP